MAAYDRYNRTGTLQGVPTKVSDGAGGYVAGARTTVDTEWRMNIFRFSPFKEELERTVLRLRGTSLVENADIWQGTCAYHEDIVLEGLYYVSADEQYRIVTVTPQYAQDLDMPTHLALTLIKLKKAT